MYLDKWKQLLCFYLFFSSLGTLFVFVPILVLFGSSLFFFVLLVVLLLLPFLGGGLVRSVILFRDG